MKWSRVSPMYGDQVVFDTPLADVHSQRETRHDFAFDPTDKHVRDWRARSGSTWLGEYAPPDRRD